MCSTNLLRNTGCPDRRDMFVMSRVLRDIIIFPTMVKTLDQFGTPSRFWYSRKTVRSGGRVFVLCTSPKRWLISLSFISIPTVFEVFNDVLESFPPQFSDPSPVDVLVDLDYCKTLSKLTVSCTRTFFFLLRQTETRRLFTMKYYVD